MVQSCSKYFFEDKNDESGSDEESFIKSQDGLMEDKTIISENQGANELKQNEKSPEIKNDNPDEKILSALTRKSLLKDRQRKSLRIKIGNFPEKLEENLKINSPKTYRFKESPFLKSSINEEKASSKIRLFNCNEYKDEKIQSPYIRKMLSMDRKTDYDKSTLFNFDFDEAANFKQYFEHNNRENVILTKEAYKIKSRKKKIKVERKKHKMIPRNKFSDNVT